MHRSSLAFSIMCMVLTVLYAGFAALTFAFSQSILEEMAADEHEEALQSTRTPKTNHFVTPGGGYDGYIGERFDMRSVGFVGPPAADRGTMA